MRQLVCLSAQPWSAVPTRTQHLMTRLRDTQVLYFQPSEGRGDRRWKEPGQRLRPGLLLYTLPPVAEGAHLPGFLQRRSQERSGRFVRDTLSRHNFREPVLWCASPAGAELLDHLPRRGLVYDCFQEWPDFPQSWEQDLTTQAEVVFAASPALAGRLSAWSANVALLPYGCNTPMFLRGNFRRPAYLRDISGPVLGYAGTLWFDLDLTPVLYAAQARPDWTFVLAGKVEDNPLLPQLAQLPNVRLPGFVEPVDLPDWLHAFDACLYLLRMGGEAPDVLSPRVFEYLSSGKPVVAMLEPGQVELFPDVVYAAKSLREFPQQCQAALSENNLRTRQRRVEYGKAAAWSERAETVEHILASIGLF